MRKPLSRGCRSIARRACNYQIIYEQDGVSLWKFHLDWQMKVTAEHDDSPELRRSEFGRPIDPHGWGHGQRFETKPFAPGTSAAHFRETSCVVPESFNSHITDDSPKVATLVRVVVVRYGKIVERPQSILRQKDRPSHG
ncbi:hypothetical protein CA13_64830 [Planctomycetes bacterium CA13]|uniref:Uncharacterized protein n=1 Tax=Novipirellula herctigrandis TaxID=2527986 RepID=A0A5C5ZDT6_9BACT|nr:hypothetical protein CA13_64830 [Planctomycetes bacterium CA13]